MKLFAYPDGTVRCLYSETIELCELGNVAPVQTGAAEPGRASYVEMDADGVWFADLAPVEGPVLGPFNKRSAALAAEEEWLLNNYLSTCS